MELTPLLPNSVNPLSQVTDAELATSSAASDFQSFLTLLTAQLRNQDPLSPLDSTEFIAQLASFSSVEQQIATNDRLEQIIEQSVTGDIAAFGSWIGRQVSTTDGFFRATGEDTSFKIDTLSSAQTATAVVKAADGRELRRIPVNPDDGTTVVWDGKSTDGSVIAAQNAAIEVEYYSDGVLTDTRPAYVATTVTGIRGSNDGIAFDLADGRRVDVTSVASLELEPET
ncbi:MAG: flagellar hook capping FlgD N-terminal domain-containing protein [Pseudomonadota bacterium]